MEFLQDPTRFSLEKRKIHCLVNLHRKLPEQVYAKAFDYFLFIDIDEISSKAFFEAIKSFTKAIGESRFYLIVLDPDPESYFYQYFLKYPFLEMVSEDSGVNYLKKLQEDPGGSPADAVVFNSNIILLYSDSLKWAVYADRSMEIGVVGLADKALRDKFITIYPKERLFSAEEAIDQLLSITYNDSIPDEVRRKLVENYSR